MTIANPGPTSFYFTGGTLPASATSYVERSADRELLSALLSGEFCYVLNSRQVGKSSLMVRTAKRLKSEGVRVAVLDLTSIGQNLLPGQWYNSLLAQLGWQLNLEDELDEFCLDHVSLSPFQRWQEALRHVVLDRLSDRVCIFVDELDVVRSLPFSTDEFFAGIRQCYTGRTLDEQLNRLTFCLIGTATPADLVTDTRTTPFNIGRRIVIEDFTAEEAAPLAQGLSSSKRDGKLLLDRILYWTGGHPYLTQSLCLRIAESEEAATRADVDRVCERTFLSSSAREADDNLAFVRRRILSNELDSSRMLVLYAKILAGREKIMDDESSGYVAALRLSGIVKAVGGRLVCRNRIYERVFDGAWIERSFPDADLRQLKARHQADILKGLLSVLAILLMPILCVVFVSLPYVDMNHFLFQQNAHPFSRIDVVRASLLFGSAATLVASYEALVLWRPQSVRLRELILPMLLILMLNLLFGVAVSTVAVGMLSPANFIVWRSFAACVAICVILVIFSGFILHYAISNRHRGESPLIYTYIAAASATPGIFANMTIINALPFSTGLMQTRAALAVNLLQAFSSGCTLMIVGFALIGYAVGVTLTAQKRRVGIALQALLLAAASWAHFAIVNELFAIVYLVILVVAISRFFLKHMAQSALVHDNQRLHE